MISTFMIDSTMLTSDGFTLTKTALTDYLVHIANEVNDLIGHFENGPQETEDNAPEADSSSSDESNEDAETTRKSFDSSYTLPEAFKTPSTSVVPRHSKAGVSWKWNKGHVC
jgi:hypothetical protein